MSHGTGRRRIAASIALALALPFAAGCGDDPIDRNALLYDLVLITEAERERSGAPGIEVGVRFSDDAVWIEQFGLSDVEADAELEADALWPLRSVTKSFTVNAVHQLADDGIVSLDDTVDEYVVGVPGGDEITLLQLADMSSGLPEYANDAFVDAFTADVTREFSDTDLLAFVADQPLLFEPGEEDVYINTNTLLLGLVVQAATGRPLGEVIDERISGPVGLDSARYAPAADDVADAVPTGYQPGADGLEPAPLTFGVFGGSGAMAAEIDDLLAWGPALATGALLDDGGDFQRRNARPLNEGPEYDAYGVGIGEIDGWWGHTGEGLGYTSLVMYDLETDTTVAIAANVSNLDEHVPTTLFRRFVPLLAAE